VTLRGILRMMRRSMFRPRSQPFVRAVAYVQGEDESVVERPS